MPSNAYAHFSTSLTDVDNLLWFHGNTGGAGQGRRSSEFQSLNKSAIVLICAAWESYIEAVIMECTEINIQSSTDPSHMLRPLKKLLRTIFGMGKLKTHGNRSQEMDGKH